MISALATCGAIIALHTIGLSQALRRGAACLWASAEAVDAAKAKYRESYGAAIAGMAR